MTRESVARLPLVTVLMPVRNGRQFLGEAAASILAQTFGDFEFLIIDDDSTDGAADDLAKLTDPRVRLHRNEQNLGITRSLNLGLDLARGTYIARMDADDVAEPHRLAAQVAFLERHPEVGVVGSWRTIIDEHGAIIATGHAPQSDEEIRWKCLLGNPLAHPTVMIRRAVLEQHGLRYDERFPAAEDYELWARLLAHTRGANIGEPLLRYRLRDGISRTNKAEQLATHDRIAHAAIRRLVPGMGVSLTDVRELRGRFGGHSVREPSTDPADPIWLERLAALRRAFDKHNAADEALRVA